MKTKKKDESLDPTLMTSNKMIKNYFSIRRDPEEEFFMLAILALKMQYSENAEAEFLQKVD